jgi:glutathione synthase/RimK-type ligase-like ATP-grasp enzyme
MPRVYFVPYKLGSESCKKVAQALSLLRIDKDKRWPLLRNGRSKLRFIINWGCTTGVALENRVAHKILNHPSSVANAVDKRKAFSIMNSAGVKTVPFTLNREQALEWLRNKSIVVVRHLVNASGGKGIEIIRPHHSTLPNAPLYTRYIRKPKEFRVHVFKGGVIDFVQKKRPLDELERPGSFIRNHEQGWIFCREGVQLPDAVRVQAISAVQALKLDFAAVDVVWSETLQQPFVLEVNTAMGLEGTTLNKYVEAFRSVL